MSTPHRPASANARRPALRRFAALTLPVALLALALLAFATPARADWPTVGGRNERHGQTPETGPPSADVLWQNSLNALFGGTCFIEAERLVTWRFQSLSVTPIVCHDLQTGAQRWSVDFGGANSRSIARGVCDGRVYATNFMETQQDTIIALDLETGVRLWTSPVRAPLGIIWTVCYAPGGDIVLPVAGDDLARLDAATGAQVWLTPRTIPNTGAEHLCVHGSTVYGFEGSITTPKVLTAWDLETGAKKYSSAALPGDGDQEIPQTVAPDGTIYVRRDGGLLYALTDTGTGIVQKWAVAVNAPSTVMQIAVGTDGSVYIPDGSQLVRLDAATGLELDRSEPLVTSLPFSPRFVIDAAGTVYCGNGGSGDGRLYCLTPDLQIVWSVAVGGMVYGGPAIGSGGRLAVAGNGTTLRVYRGPTESAPGPLLTARRQVSAYPNPFASSTVVRFSLSCAGAARLWVHDAGGRRLRSLVGATHLDAGEHRAVWDGRDESGREVEAGVYFFRLAAEGETSTGCALRIR